MSHNLTHNINRFDKGDYAMMKLVPPSLGNSKCIRFTDYTRPACLNRDSLSRRTGSSGNLNGYRRVNDVRMFAAQTNIADMNVTD